MLEDKIKNLGWTLTNLNGMVSHQQSRPLDHDEAAELINDIQVAKARFKEITEILKEAELAAVESVGDVTIGDKRYYIGYDKKITQDADTDEICGAIAEAGKPIATCLVKQPFKQGAVKEVVGEEQWREFFAVEAVPDVKTGKPRRNVQVADRKFTKGRL